MKILKLILIIPLVFVLLWSTLLIAGPGFLKGRLIAQFDENIEIGKIEVRPNLEIIINRLLISSTNNSPVEIRGFFMKPSIDSGSLEIEVKVGVVNISDIGNVRDLTLTTQDFMSDEAFDISATAESAQFFRTNFNQISSNFSFDPNTNTPSDMMVEVASADMEYFIKNITDLRIKLHDLPPLRELGRTAITGDVISGEGTFAAGNLDFSASDTRFEFRDDKLKLDYTFEKLRSEQVDVEVNSAKGSITLVARVEPTLITWTQEMKDLQLHTANFPILETLFINDNGVFDFKANGILDNTLLQFNQLPLIELNNVTVEAEMRVERDALSTITLTSATVPKLTLNAQTSVANLLGADGHLCVSIDCVSIPVKIEYTLEVSEERLTGNSLCMSTSCSSEVDKHEISTANTNALFEALQNTGEFKPLPLGIGYMALLGGEPIGAGHRLKF